MLSAMRLGVLRTYEGIAEVDEAVRARSTKLKCFFVDFNVFSIVVRTIAPTTKPMGVIYPATALQRAIASRRRAVSSFP